MFSWNQPKFFQIFFLLFCFSLPAFGQELQSDNYFDEIKLNLKKNVTTSQNNNFQKKTLKGGVSLFKQLSPSKQKKYYFDLGNDLNVFGNIDIDVRDQRNQKIKSTEVSLRGNIAPSLKYNYTFQGNNLFSQNEQTSILNNAYLSTNIIPNHTIYIGQAKLSKDDNRNINFLESMENLYGKNDVGLKIGGDLGLFDYSAGAYNINDTNKDADSNNFASGATATLKPFHFNPNLGKFEIGGAYYSKKNEQDLKSTYGLFSKYKYKRVSLKGEYSKKNDATLSEERLNNWNVSNKINFTDNFSFITAYDQQVETQKSKNDFILEYSMTENSLIKINNLKLQFNASYVKDHEIETRKKFGLNAKYFF